MWRSRAVSFLTLGLLIGTVANGRERIPAYVLDNELLLFGAVVAFLLLFVVVQRKLVLPFVVLRQIQADERATFPLEWNNAHTDKLHLNAHPTTSLPPGWKCKQCREENPGGFDLCWKCGHDRAQAGA
jgi:hypothetical protein